MIGAQSGSVKKLCTFSHTFRLVTAILAPCSVALAQCAVFELEPADQGLHIAAKRRDYLHLLFSDRMSKTKRGGVQIQVLYRFKFMCLVIGVLGVTDNGMPNMLAMDTNLMSSSSNRHGFDKTGTFKVLKHLKPGY